MKEQNHRKLVFVVVGVRFVETKREVEFFVEDTVFEGYGVVVLDGGNMEFEVVRTVNGTVAVELEEAHAVFYYVWKGTHYE